MHPLFFSFAAPDWQSWHIEDPNPNDTFAPGHILQAVDVDAPSPSLYVPGAQSLQVVFESAPTAVENLPTVQLTQVETDTAPSLLLYFPASHEWQPVETLYETVE